MTSPRQIDANRRNARLSTGPVTAEGKRRSRRNALRHGLTAETVIDALEDADDYAAFEMAVTADFEATSAVERELVLRLASLLWRLRRATAIETGLFEIEARHLLQFRQARQAHRERPRIIDNLCRTSTAATEPAEMGPTEIESESGSGGTNAGGRTDDANYSDLTRTFVRLTSLPTYPLDRLSRYEATLWRQAGQILFALQFMNRQRPWVKARSRGL
jgi:hypothetical protein